MIMLVGLRRWYVKIALTCLTGRMIGMLNGHANNVKAMVESQILNLTSRVLEPVTQLMIRCQFISFRSQFAKYLSQDTVHRWD